MRLHRRAKQTNSRILTKDWKLRERSLFLLLTTMAILFVLFLCIYACSSLSELELIWYDSLDNFTTHWTSTGSPSQQTNDTTNAFCATSSKCVKIRGYRYDDEWITRPTALPLIQNLNLFTSFFIQFDVTLYDLEHSNYCQVKYKYDTDSFGDYRVVKSFAGLDSTATIPIQKINETETIQMPQNHSSRPNVLWIKLEADGDSSSGNDICFFDNVYLYGKVSDDSNVLFYDNMDNILLTEWKIANESNNGSITQIRDGETDYCASNGCVQIAGFEAYDNSISNSYAGIGQYYDLVIEFDAYLRDMEDENGCQVFYRYDTDPESDWYLLYSLVGGNGDQFYYHQMVSIYENPKHKGSNVLYIKLKNNGDSSSGHDWCYFDNIYVKGSKHEEDNYFNDHLYDENVNKSHIIIMGDMGGQLEAPFYTSEQVTTADMMSTIAKQYNISGIIALGDNIYDRGVRDEFDSRFQTTFEDVYTHSNIKDINWYFTSGNHDYGNGHSQSGILYGNISGEIEYSKHSKRWNFPFNYYTKTWYFDNDVSLLFVALDTYILCGLVRDTPDWSDCVPPDPDKAIIHWNWLNDTLYASNATFKLVGGHTPIFSYASHGPTKQLIANLNPMLDHYNVNAYIFGHDHVLQYIEDLNTTTHHIGSGAGHGCRDSFRSINSELNPGLDALKYMDCNQGGFVRLSIDTTDVTMQAFYYLSDRPFVRFFTGIWDQFGGYETIQEIEDETFAPTLEPTTEPTIEPSAEPTLEPTQVPTIEPSMEPTFMTTDMIMNETDIVVSSSTTSGGDDGKKEDKKGEKAFLYILIICAVALVVIGLIIGLVLLKRWKSHKAEAGDGYQSLLGDDGTNNGQKVGKKTSFFEMQS